MTTCCCSCHVQFISPSLWICYHLQSCHDVLSMLYCFLAVAQCSCFVVLDMYMLSMPFDAMKCSYSIYFSLSLIHSVFATRTTNSTTLWSSTQIQPVRATLSPHPLYKYTHEKNHHLAHLRETSPTCTIHTRRGKDAIIHCTLDFSFLFLQ